MNSTTTALRHEVHRLADEAFQLKLISGHGDGANTSQYQIVWNGKPRQLSLEHAKSLLTLLVKKK